MRAPTHAFVLAAGLGTRMRPLTNTQPKPLIKVGGKPLIDHAMDALRAAGVRTAVVNAHYMSDQIVGWGRGVSDPRIVISDESDQLLDTGGGILKALLLLGSDPFYVLNSDGFWLDDGVPSLVRLAQAWRDDAMDCLLLLSPLEKAMGYDGRGDFHVDTDGRLVRLNDASRTAYAYIGGYVVHPRLFAGVTETRFSMNVLWNKAIASGRLHGLVHQGLWLHVGTPDAVVMAQSHLASR